MKHLFTLLLLSVWATSAQAQALHSGKLTGSLTDSTTAKPVPFATAALMDGAKLVTGTTTDGAGAFVLPNIPVGSYTLALSFVGYQTKRIPVTLTTDQPVRQL
ncbi:MAG: carboxypeptidase-like regulatory domain-containing protein, partial [Pedobacter sp.]